MDRPAKLFVEEAKEAMDALSAIQYEASKALSSRKTLEELVLELETKVGVCDLAVAELQAEVESLKRKLASSEREKGDATAMLLQIRERNCTCEENRTELNETISRLNGNIRDMQARVADADGLKLAFEASFEQEQTLKKRLAEMQSKFEQESKRASDKESAGYKLLDTLSGKTAPCRPACLAICSIPAGLPVWRSARIASARADQGGCAAEVKPLALLWLPSPLPLSPPSLS